MYWKALFLSVSLTLTAAEPSPLMRDTSKVEIHNRILTKVQGKTISIMDVVKKMDVFLNENYKDVADSPTNRFQFYNAQWKSFFQQMVDDELMIADADKLGVKVNDADVREQIHVKFGPNVMKNLDKMGLNYEEAKKMVWSEMIAQRMMWFRVSSKALQKVFPEDIKKTYKEYVNNHPPQDIWKYEVLSVKGKDKEESKDTAVKASNLILQTQAGLKAAAEIIKAKSDEAKKASVNVSEVITVADKEISKQHKDELIRLQPGAYSEPVEQINRFSNEVVYRIFHLLEHQKQEAPTFNSLSEKFREELLQKEAGETRESYLSKLRKRFGYDAEYVTRSIPSDFQPFTLIP